MGILYRLLEPPTCFQNKTTNSITDRSQCCRRPSCTVACFSQSSEEMSPSGPVAAEERWDETTAHGDPGLPGAWGGHATNKEGRGERRWILDYFHYCSLATSIVAPPCGSDSRGQTCLPSYTHRWLRPLGMTFTNDINGLLW